MNETVANASGSQRCVCVFSVFVRGKCFCLFLFLFPCLFRVNPWLILLLLLLLILPSVKFRVNPWLVFCLFLIPWLIHCFLVHPFV